MELKEIKCKNCGAPIVTKPDESGKVVCAACDSKFVYADPSDAGRPPVPLFKKKIRVIPESYINETLGKTGSDTSKGVRKEWTAERLRQLAKFLRFLALVIGFIPSAFYAVYLIGYIIGGFPTEDLEVFIPMVSVLTAAFVGYFLSAVWELQGGIVLIAVSVILFIMMNIWMAGADILQMLIYPIPFMASGVLSIAHYFSKLKLKEKIAAQKLPA